MSEPINDGGPAFPVKTVSTDGFGNPILSVDEQGMSLRDYFAAKAMNGLLSMSGSTRDSGWSDLTVWQKLEVITRDSYEIADAMLKARQQ